MPSEPSAPPATASSPPDALPDPEREFRGAVIALSREPGFRLNAALFRSRAVRDRTHERLRLALAEVNVLLTTLDLRAHPTDLLLRELEQHLAAQPTPAGQRRAIAVLGLEDRLGLAIAGLPGGDDERALLHNANLHRDAFPRFCPCPLLLWVTDGAFRELIREARDLWHWRAHTFQFPEGDDQSAPPSGITTPSLQSIGDPLPYRDFHEREDALQLFQQTLRNYEVLGQGESSEACEVRDRIGRILYDLGRYAEAEPLLRQNLTIREKSRGTEHPETLGSVNNLAGLLCAKHDLAGAEPLLRRALAAHERVLGDEHPSTLTSVNNLAELLRDKSDLAGAEPLYRRALAVRERVLGSEHPSTLTSMNNLACLLEARGDLDGAEPLYRRALAVRERMMSDAHPGTLTVVNNLAGLLWTKGDLAGAEPLLRRTLEIRERVLGAEHPDTLISVFDLAALRKAQGKLDEAEQLAVRAEQGFRATLGAEHPHTKNAQSWVDGLRQKRAVQRIGQ